MIEFNQNFTMKKKTQYRSVGLLIISFLINLGIWCKRILYENNYRLFRCESRQRATS